METQPKQNLSDNEPWILNHSFTVYFSVFKLFQELLTSHQMLPTALISYRSQALPLFMTVSFQLCILGTSH